MFRCVKLLRCQSQSIWSDLTKLDLTFQWELFISGWKFPEGDIQLCQQICYKILEKLNGFILYFHGNRLLDWLINWKLWFNSSRKFSDVLGKKINLKCVYKQNFDFILISSRFALCYLGFNLCQCFHIVSLVCQCFHIVW